MKKVLLLSMLCASSTLFAQKSDLDNLPPSTNAAVSGAVQMENDGFRKFGTNAFRIYTPSSVGFGKVNLFDNGVFHLADLAESQVFGFGVNADGRLEFIADGVAALGTTSTKMVIDDNNGNVGIGELVPTGKLHIKYNSGLSSAHLNLEETSSTDGPRIDFANTNTNKFTLYGAPQSTPVASTFNIYYSGYTDNGGNILTAKGDGNVGIGNSSPTAKFQIDHAGSDTDPHINIRATSSWSRINWTTTANANKWVAQSYLQSTNAAVNYLRFEYGPNPDVLVLQGDGNVGIGTSSPDNKLDVKGIIRAEEVIVETGWADYVFADDYQLNDLNEVESFIKANKHLPNVPAASEIQEKGAHVSALMTKMMEKIEELTLYTIRQQKEIDAMKVQLQNK